MLCEIYKGIEGVKLFDSWKQRDEILKAIVAAPKDEPILLLGRGCPSGLLDMRYGIGQVRSIHIRNPAVVVRCLPECL